MAFLVFLRRLPSHAILDATLKGDNEAVAKTVKRTHMTKPHAIGYNRELSLKCAMGFSYPAAGELYYVLGPPARDWFADAGYIPMSTKDHAYFHGDKIKSQKDLRKAP